MVTLKDIAKITGIHVSTVSRALRDSDDINIETKKMVRKIAQELQYNIVKSKKVVSEDNSFTIGVITPEIVSGCYATIVDVIEKKLSSSGYTILIGCTNFISSEEIRLLHVFANKGVEGIILIRSVDEAISEGLIKFKKMYNIPLVQVEMDYVVDIYDCIKFDDLSGITLLIKHLFDLGHRVIGYVGDYASVRRKNKFIESIEKMGLPLDENNVRFGNERFEAGGYLRMKEILAREKLPTAIVAAYDLVAIGAMKAIYEQGLKIPKDISIVGIDDISVAQYMETGLTTISVPSKELGELSSKILLNKINDKNYQVIQHVELKPQLIVRASTCPASDK